MTLSNDLQTTIDYYKDLILYQYINLPKAKAVIELLVNSALVDLLPIALQDAFLLDSAIGAQLDIIGEYVGLSRNVVEQISRNYFIFNNITSLNAGFAYGFIDYNNPIVNRNSVFLDYFMSQNTTYSMSDDEYRILIKLKISMNNSNNSLSAIAIALYGFFGTSLILGDQRDMSISYIVSSAIENIIFIAKSANILPRPMGVELTGFFSVADPTKMWGFQDSIINNNFILGFNSYNASTNNRLFLSYSNGI